MDQRYKEIHREAQKLRHKVHDLLDEPAHRLAQLLKSEFQRLEDEIEMSKAPRALEDRVKTIQRHLVVAGQGGDNLIMDIGHATYLHDVLEDFRTKLRRMPHY